MTETLLKEKCKAILNRHKKVLKRFWYYSNEWWYNEIPARIIIEEHLTPGTGSVPVDYKFFVFGGCVEFVQVDLGRFVNHTRTLYSRDWIKQEFQLGYPHCMSAEKPSMLSEMISVAEALANDVDFLRVDLYQIGADRVVFEELTVCPSLGHGRFNPSEWDKKLGQLSPTELGTK